MDKDGSDEIHSKFSYWFHEVCVQEGRNERKVNLSVEKMIEEEAFLISKANYNKEDCSREKINEIIRRVKGVFCKENIEVNVSYPNTDNLI